MESSRNEETSSTSEPAIQTLYEREAIATFRDFKLPGCVYGLGAMAGFHFLSEVALNSIITVFILDVLKLEQHLAVSTVLIYRCLASNMIIVVAFLSDNYFGNFNTLLFGWIVYIISITLFALTSLPLLISYNWLIYVAITLRGLGGSCCQASMLPFVNDQMKIGQMMTSRQVTNFYFCFIWTASLLDFLSVIVVTLLKENLRCFNWNSCYLASFIYCLSMSILGFLVFIFGLKTYLIIKPAEAVSAKAPCIIAYALWKKMRNRTRQENHWLDYAKEKYDSLFVEDLKLMLNVVTKQMFIFWTLQNQRYSIWTIQATRVSRDMQFVDIKVMPEQVQAMYPFFLMILIPTHFFFGRHFLTRFIKTPLFQMALAVIILVLALICSMFLSIIIEYDDVRCSKKTEVRMTVFNGRNCSVDIVNDSHLKSAIKPFSFRNFILDRTEFEKRPIFFKCNEEDWSGIRLASRSRVQEYYYFISNIGTLLELPAFKKLKDDWPENTLIYCLCSNELEEIILTVQGGGNKEYLKICSGNNVGPMFEVFPGESYKLSLNGTVMLKKLVVYYGDAIILLIYSTDSSLKLKHFRVLTSNEISFYWMIPQYLLLSVSSMLFLPAVFIFQYNETPHSCMALVLSLKHFNSGLDSVLMATSSLFLSQSMVLLIWTIFTSLYVSIFIILVRKYKYSTVNPFNAYVRERSNVRSLIYN